MFSLRQVIFLFLMSSPLLSSISFGAAGLFRSTLDIQNSSGNASSLTQEDSTNAQGLSQTFEMISPTLKKYWTISSSIKVSKIDSALLVTKDSKGHDVNWSEQDNQFNNVGTLGVTFATGPSTSSIKYGQSLDNSVYQSRSFSGETEWNLNSMTTFLGLQLVKSEADRPQNFVFDNFTSDSTLTWRERPTRLTRNRWTGSVDQIWTELYKTRTEIFYQERNQERPQSAGFVLKNSYSFNSYHVARWDVGTAAEDRSQSLLDERGYFQMNWLEAAWSQGLTYNFWITASYGFLQEIEAEPRTGKKSQVGSDVFGIHAKYLGKGWIGSIKWQSLESSSEFKSQQMQGALEWEI